MSLFWRKKLVTFKIETEYGVDASPVGGDAMRTVDLSITPMEGSDEDRNLDTPHFGPTGTLPTELHQKINFKVELSGSGTAGTAPAYGPLLRACGMAETVTPGTSVVYNPISAGLESGTLYLNIGGDGDSADTLYKLPGFRGTATFRINAQAIPYIEIEGMALYRRPVDDPAAVPDFSGFTKPLVASKANTPVFTLNGTSMKMSEFSLAQGNVISPEFLVGEEKILIEDHENVIETKVIATDMATFNPWELAETQGEVALSLTHGTTAGNIIQLAAPKAQMMRPGAPEDRKGRKVWPLTLSPLANAGNDNWTLTFT